MNIRRILSTTAILIGAMSLSVGLQALALTHPAGSPPLNDAYAPLNTGPTTQLKKGGLVIGTGSGVTAGLVVQNGLVGIGTPSPAAKLQVVGTATKPGKVYADDFCLNNTDPIVCMGSGASTSGLGDYQKIASPTLGFDSTGATAVRRAATAGFVVVSGFGPAGANLNCDTIIYLSANSSTGSAANVIVARNVSNHDGPQQAMVAPVPKNYYYKVSRVTHASDSCPQTVWWVPLR